MSRGCRTACAPLDGRGAPGPSAHARRDSTMAELNKVAVFTKEYPPYVYGGAGVHVEYLCRELARLVPVEVRCFSTNSASNWLECLADAGVM